MTAQIDQQQRVGNSVDKARSEGAELVGPGGLLTRLMKSVLETTAGHKREPVQPYCGERLRRTQTETQRPGRPLPYDHDDRCLCW